MKRNTGDIHNLEYQHDLENAVVNYQHAVASGDKMSIEDAYQKIVGLYNPMDFFHNWYEQYKYLFDSQEDFIADYLRVFATVLLGWKPRESRGQSRYDGSGEFKNYFIGSLYHNYINLIKSDQAAKRNLTKMCPLCGDWVNPLSTHLITKHEELLWDYLNEMGIDIDSLLSCPFCSNFKISKSLTDKAKITNLIKKHFLSKHTSMLFHKFNDDYPECSTISPRMVSTHIEEGDDELDIYDVTEKEDSLFDKLSVMDLSDLQKFIIEEVANGESNLVYKPGAHQCTKEEWDSAMENLKETLRICGYKG